MAAEIEIPRRTLRVITVLLAAFGLAMLGFLGWANSPRDAGGRPLLLSPERRAILRYLDTAEGWAGRLAEVGALLDGLMPPDAGPPANSELPTPPAPEAQPADLYRRTHEAQKARAALEDLAREVERARVPDALMGLHGLVVDALGAHLAWADGVLAYVGAPEAVDPGELAALRAEARARLADFEEALMPDAVGEEPPTTGGGLHHHCYLPFVVRGGGDAGR